MFSLSEQQQKELAKKLVLFLSSYKYISDSYIIEFFSEDLWKTLPEGWQRALGDLTAPQIAELLLETQVKERVYPSVWPLSLLAMRATAHSLQFPRSPPDHQSQNSDKSDEFHSNMSQSALLDHIFRKHVKPKKQHEIRKLGMLVKELCDQTGCSRVVDVGSGQGHLTRYLSFGLGLDVTAVEADPNLVSTGLKHDEQLLSTLAKECKKSNIVATTLNAAPQHIVGWVNPKDSWQIFLQQLKRREKHCESYPGTTVPCKKRQHVSVSPGKGEPETDLVHGSQHLCQKDSSFSAVGDKTSATSGPQEHVGVTSSVVHPDPATSEPHPQTDLVSNLVCKNFSGSSVKDSAISALPFPEKMSSLHHNTHSENPVHSDFIVTGLHACGDLSATLLRHFANCPHIRGITSVACCYMKITTEENPTPPGVTLFPCSDVLHEVSQTDYGYPMSEWVKGLAGHQLSYKAREGACHAIEDYLCRLRKDSELLKIHGFRATLETIIRAERPELRRAGIQTIKKAHMLPFAEYARLGLGRVGLPTELNFDPVFVESLLVQQDKVVVYFSLALLLAPVVETLVLLDRMMFLQEKGFQSQLVPLFDPALSPRNLVLTAVKPKSKEADLNLFNSLKPATSI